MPKKRSIRKLELFALHARVGTTRANYQELFSFLAGLSPEIRKYESGETVFAFPKFEVTGDIVSIIASTGERGDRPLIHSLASGLDEIMPLADDKFLANRVHTRINLDIREAVIEYNHKGAKADQIAHAIEKVASEHDPTRYGNLAVELIPIAHRDFIEAIDSFERIRLASVTIVQPNPDWLDHRDHLTSLANESEGREAKVEITADRGESLSKLKGIVALIMDLTRERLSFVRNAIVKGTRPGEEKEGTASLNDHTLHQRIEVVLEDGHVSTADIEPKIQAFEAARAKELESPQITTDEAAPKEIG